MFDSEAKKVVYVLDGSGSGQVYVSPLRNAMKDTVSKLGTDQSFNVIFFGGDNVVSFNPTLVAPKADVQRRLADWVDKFQPKGGSNPIPALRQAFQLQPEEIVFLCNDLDPKTARPVLVKEIEKLNLKKKVKINVIHVRSGNEDAADASVLEEVSKQSGGSFIAISSDDFRSKF
jgi:hypothetical protein